MSKKSSVANRGPGFFTELIQQAKLVFQLLLDPKVPLYLKALPFAAVAYLLFPVDILPDVIPGLGQIDDITILLIGAKLFIELSPQEIVAKYLQKFQNSEAAPVDLKPANDSEAAGDVIEGIVIEDSDD